MDEGGVEAGDRLDAVGAVQHEGNPVHRFLVPAEQPDKGVGVGSGGQTGGQLVAANHLAMLLHPGGVNASGAMGQLSGVDEPDRHCLAVAEAVASVGFEGVGQGVAVVEHRPSARLALIGRHHLGLDLHAAGDALDQIQRAQIGVGDEVVFCHLPHPRAHLLDRQRVERLGVAQHSRRLPEGAHQVLALGEVDPGLAADGGVDLAQQGGGHVHHPDTPVVDGCGETAQVGDCSPAHGHHGVAAGEPPLGELPAQFLDRAQLLDVLVVVSDEHPVLNPRIHGDARVGHSRLGNHRNPLHLAGNDLSQPMADPGANPDVVGPLPQLNRDPDRAVQDGFGAHRAGIGRGQLSATRVRLIQPTSPVVECDKGQIRLMCPATCSASKPSTSTTSWAVSA